MAARMASANTTQTANDKLIIFKGDDTGGTFGRPLLFTIYAGEGVSLDGCRAEWIFDGIVKEIDAPLVPGEVREVFYSHNETRCMALGVRYGTFRIIDAAGKVRTFTNTKPVEVTNNAARCYPGSSSASVVVSGIGDMKHSEFADLEEKEGMTLNEVGGMVNTLIRKLKGMVSAFAALFALGAFCAVTPTPDTDFGDIDPFAKLKAVVEASGAISGIDTNAVERIANRAVETNAVTAALASSVSSLQSSKLDKTNAYTRAETDAKLVGKLDTRGKLVWDDAHGSLILGDDETSVDTKRLMSFGKARFYGSLEVAEDWGHVVLTDGDTPIETLPEFVTNVVDGLSDGVVRTNEHGDAVLHALQTTDGEGHPTGIFIGDNGAGDGISVSIPGSTVVNPLNVYSSPSPDPSVTRLGWGVYGLVDPRLIEFITGCTLQSLLDEKANRPVDFDSTNAGNLAALTADGDLADSGKTVDDFLAKDEYGQVEDAVFPDPYDGLKINPGGLGVQSFASWLRSGEWFDYTVTFLNVYYFQKITCGNIEVGNDGYGSADITPIISATNPTFSNAVLAVGLNIDTNSVAVLNEIAATFGGFPIEGTATTVGGLLAALAAAAAWLKKNKVGAFESVGGATATVDNGVAKLDGFFTESNSLLTGRVNTLIDAKVGDVNAVLAAALDGTEVA